jgi:hypothetical protein
MFKRLRLFCFTLFILNGLSSCSNESGTQHEAVSSLSVKDYIAEEETGGHKATAEELTTQFHGCKAHQ